MGSAPPEVEAACEQRGEPIPSEGRLLGPERPFARRDHRGGGAVCAVRQRLRVVLLKTFFAISLENAPSHLLKTVALSHLGHSRHESWNSRKRDRRTLKKMCRWLS